MSKARGFLQEFQEFAVKGNMIDLAVGVIIGAAFGKIIDSLVSDVIMPIISFILGGEVDFTNKFWVLRVPEGFSGPVTPETLNEVGAVVLYWGSFVTVLLNFVLLALVVFCLVKAVNTARTRVVQREKVEAAQEEAVVEPAPDPADIALLREIRDLLSRQQRAE